MNNIMKVLYENSTENGEMRSAISESGLIEKISNLLGKETYSNIEVLLAECLSVSEVAAYEAGFNDAMKLIVNR